MSLLSFFELLLSYIVQAVDKLKEKTNIMCLREVLGHHELNSTGGMIPTLPKDVPLFGGGERCLTRRLTSFSYPRNCSVTPSVQWIGALSSCSSTLSSPVCIYWMCTTLCNVCQGRCFSLCEFTSHLQYVLKYL